MVVKSRKSRKKETKGSDIVVNLNGLNNLKPAFGAKHRKKIVGRGEGSGHGGTSTRGMRGQKCRSGDGKMIGFEGGQMPLLRRIPKRGFTNKFRQPYAVINVETLDACFDSGAEVTSDKLREKGLIKKDWPVKVLGDGEIKKALTVKTEAFSKQAIEKIKAAGGTAETKK
ncbi:MAG: 50S ribosomal protein L15 [Endomicrobiales bacterium]|nr:50S ribosomal protein L15 [Endomicrobiales bacterium]